METKLVDAHLQGADLKGIIDFSHADLTGADLRGIDLEGEVNFEGAILHNVNFIGSNIDKASLKLDGADIKDIKGLEISKSSKLILEPLSREKYVDSHEDIIESSYHGFGQGTIDFSLKRTR